MTSWLRHFNDAMTNTGYCMRSSSLKRHGRKAIKWRSHKGISSLRPLN